ncbi:MAG TPA: hypothetical protein VEY70_21535 [Metabacillus sp.]|nr:hypothetical protein [Metabacillus sp.]
MLSLVIAYIGTNLMYQGRIHTEIRNTLVSNGEKVIEIYKSTESDHLLPFLEAFSGTAQTRLQLYNQEGVSQLVIFMIILLSMNFIMLQLNPIKDFLIITSRKFYLG